LNTQIPSKLKRNNIESNQTPLSQIFYSQILTIASGTLVKDLKWSFFL